MVAASLAFLLLSKHRLQKGFPCSAHLSAGRSSPKTWMLDVTAKLGTDVGPGVSSDPFQTHLFSDHPVVRWGEAVPLEEGLVHDGAKALLPPAPTVQSSGTNRRTKDNSEERMWKLLETYLGFQLTAKNPFAIQLSQMSDGSCHLAVTFCL